MPTRKEYHANYSILERLINIQSKINNKLTTPEPPYKLNVTHWIARPINHNGYVRQIVVFNEDMLSAIQVLSISNGELLELLKVSSSEYIAKYNYDIEYVITKE